MWPIVLPLAADAIRCMDTGTTGRTLLTGGIMKHALKIDCTNDHVIITGKKSVLQRAMKAGLLTIIHVNHVQGRAEVYDPIDRKQVVNLAFWKAWGKIA